MVRRVTILLSRSGFLVCCSFALLSCNESHGASGGTTSARAGDALSAAAPTVDAGHPIIRAEAVGPLRVGTWRRPAMSFVYAVGATAGPNGEDMIAVRGIGQDTLTLAFIDDTLRRIEIKRPGPHTVDGIGVGTPLSAISSQPGARSGSVDGTEVVTLDRYCGIDFMRNTVARKPAVIAEIVVHSCPTAPKATAATRAATPSPR